MGSLLADAGVDTGCAPRFVVFHNYSGPLVSAACFGRSPGDYRTDPVGDLGFGGMVDLASVRRPCAAVRFRGF